MFCWSSSCLRAPELRTHRLGFLQTPFGSDVLRHGTQASVCVCSVWTRGNIAAQLHLFTPSACSNQFPFADRIQFHLICIAHLTVVTKQLHRCRYISSIHLWVHTFIHKYLSIFLDIPIKQACRDRGEENLKRPYEEETLRLQREPLFSSGWHWTNTAVV